MLNHRYQALLGVFLAILLTLFIGSAPALSDGEEEIELGIEKEGKATGRYIVVFKDNVRSASQLSSSLARGNSASLGHVYSHALKGFAGQFTPEVVERLRNNPSVAYVEPDLPVWAVVLPTGVDRIDADQNPIANIDGVDDPDPANGERVDVDVAIIDTGLDIGNPDLNIAGGVRFFSLFFQDNNFNDDNGHGTHVGGTVGAIDNNIGVVGVAPGARLWGVKVLDNTGNGFISDIVKGIDWVTATHNDGDPNNDIEVINMSLAGIGNSVSFRTAVQNSVNTGIVVVAAAGNAQQDVFGSDGVFGTLDDVMPAAFPETMTISAMADFDGLPGGLNDQTAVFSTCTEDEDDSFACFSNFSQTDHTGGNQVVNSPGAAIDLMMPGLQIESTENNGTTSFKSGTSMASPHAAGLAALYIAQNGAPTNASEVYALRQALIDNGMNQASGNRLDHLDEPDSNPEPLGWAGPLGDTPPSASIVNPTDGSIVTGTVTVQVDASDLQDPVGTLNVEFAIDSGAYSPMVYNGGTGFYEANWDSSASGDGSHTIDARATDSGANTTNATQISVNVITNLTDIAITDISPSSPSVTEGDTVTIDVEVSNLGNQTVNNIDVTLDDQTSGSSIDSPQNIASLAPGGDTTIQFTWDTTGESFGAHTLVASHNISDDVPGNDSAQTVVTVNSASGSITEDWTGTNGFPWPAQWSFDDANQADNIDILNNEGRVGGDSSTPGSGIVAAYINSAESEDVDATVTFRISSNEMGFGLMSRRNDSDSDTYYYTRVQGSKDKLQIYKSVDGAETKIGQTTIGSISSGTNYNMRFVTQANGGSTDLQAKVWNASSSEPASFQLEISDSESRLQGVSGRFGLRYEMFRNRVVFTDDYAAIPGAPPAVNDVEITSVTPSVSSIIEGGNVTVDVVVTNIGDLDSGSFDVSLFDNTDSSAVGSPQNVANLASGANTTVQFNWDTTGASAGDHDLEASHDLSDDNNGNNSGNTTVTVIAAILDVELTSVTATPDSIKQGGAISVDVVVTNIGNVDSGSFDVSLEDTTDVTAIGTPQNVANLTPGASTTINFNWDTTSASVGVHTLTGSHNLADAPNDGNNTDTTTATVDPLILDVELTSVTANTPSTIEGGVITVDVVVTNLGDLDSGSFNVSLEDTTDATAIGTPQNVANLASGANTTVQFNWDTTGASAGIHTLTGSHDLADAPNDGNNTDTTTATVIAAVLDVELTSVTAIPDTEQQGNAISVDVVVTNIGNVDSGSFDVSLEDTTDTSAIGTPQNVANLTPGASTTINFNWDTTGASIGVHTLTGSHDLADAPNDGNNSNTETATINPLVLDVAVTSVTPSSSSVTEGDTITVDVVVENVGDLASGAFNVSLNDDTDSSPIGTPQNVTDLAPGANTTIQFTWDTTGASINLHTLTGSHDLADDNNTNDSDQANVNVTSSSGLGITEDWDGPNGSSWPAQWSFDDATQADIVDIFNNRGRLGDDNDSGNGVVVAYINSTNAENVNANVTFNISSNAMGFGMAARRADSNNDTYYYSRIESGKNKLSIHKVVNGVETKLGQATIFTITPNTDWNMRFDVSTNGGSTDLSAKVWDSASAEPGAFDVVLTDSEPSLQGVSGRFGLYYELFRNRNTKTDDYEAQ